MYVIYDRYVTAKIKGWVSRALLRGAYYTLWPVGTDNIVPYTYDFTICNAVEY